MKNGGYKLKELGKDITLLYGFAEECCMYALKGRDKVLLVDTGMGTGDLKKALGAIAPGLPYVVVNTHGHADHCGGDMYFGEVYMSAAAEPDAREALDDALGGTTFYENVRNDVTGKWRVLVFYSAENIVDHATEYYNTYFSSDDEIHIAVNLGLKTTSVMNVSGGVMSIGVHEYIDKEEHDAKVLGGGELLKSYTVNLETGETEDVSAE